MSSPVRLRYVIVSAVKDEERFVTATLESVAAQTTRPVRWIIVDDGSLDSTAEIVTRFAQRHPWICLMRRSRQSNRQPGGAVVAAFNQGYELVRSQEFDCVVKLDCDLRLEPDYFERILSRFNADPKLGIASGVYLEANDSGWSVVPMPPYHAAGASKVIRRECFEAISGFVAAAGWDTVDEIRAQLKGWKTRHFDDLKFFHLKKEGSGIGQLRTNFMHGRVFYKTGGGLGFLILKTAHRLLSGRPPVVGGLVMLVGFLRPLMLREERLVSDQEAALYQELLKSRIRSTLGNHVIARLHRDKAVS